MLLKIKDLPGENLAQLSASIDDAAWREIRRDLQDQCGNVNNIDGTTLTVPWWAFFRALETIDYRIRRYDVDFELDSGASRLLEEAKGRRDSYSRAIKSKSASSSAVVTALRKSGFVRRLTPNQLRNVCKLGSLPAGATFSVPGAGKTTEALAYYSLKAQAETRLLVVCPKNAFATWEEQLQLCCGNNVDGFVRLVGGEKAIKKSLSKDPRLMLISYQQVPTVRDLLAGYITRHPTVLFLDESHRIKLGERGEIGRFVLSISHIPVAKLILTGTPMPNSFDDLLPQFAFLYPEVQSDATDIVDKMRIVYVRTTKAELKLPKLKLVSIPVAMADSQRKLYELMRSEEARSSEKTLRSRDRIAFRSLGKSVMRLLQAASNPALLIRAGIPHDALLREVLKNGDSPKIEYVCKRARSLAAKGRKVLIWSTFVENVELLASRLRDLGADFIHGKVDTGSDEEENTRERKIKRFKTERDAMVLIANPAACSESISLHDVCHNAIYLDRNYNAAQFMQSEDRIHRLGLPASVETLIEIVYSPETIDESVDRRLRHKVSAMARALNDTSLNIDPVSFDPDAINEDDALDSEDVKDFMAHLRS